jgi:hypothetical protein
MPAMESILRCHSVEVIPLLYTARLVLVLTAPRYDDVINLRGCQIYLQTDDCEMRHCSGGAALARPQRPRGGVNRELLQAR